MPLHSPETIVLTPNDGPPLKHLYAFVSRDPEGHENVLAGGIPGVGMTPFITGNARTFRRFREMAALISDTCNPERQTIHLVRFERGEELSDWNGVEL